jgi:leucyl-tRNA synthetase
MSKDDLPVYEGYDHRSIEKRLTDLWEKEELYKTPDGLTKENKYYILPQLPYPSGSGLHVGHSEVYTSCDIFSRFQRMQGKKVLQVMGWDAFGLPAENFAIKTNVHPRINTDRAIDNFRDQIKKMGVSVDWAREVGSHNPDYYKWTQWFFQLMYDQGLVYRKKQAVNWCDSCKTVLANEQVEDGACERCDTDVVQKDLEQWFLKITDHADRLQKNLDNVDWPKESIKRQRDWIGKSEGAEIDFELVGIDDENRVKVYTTAHDTIYGATFMVIAPEHKILKNIKSSISNWGEIEEYINLTKHKTELDRQIQKEKTGVRIEGVEAVNPANGKKIPIFVADYVLVTYGTGSIMGVPGHDDRDFEFAKKYNLEVIYLAKSLKPRKDEDKFISYSEEIKSDLGSFEMENSEEFDGMTFAQARDKILAKLQEMGVAKAKTEYRLRDWLVSRQRFWGAPIPVLYKPLSKQEEERNKVYESLPSLVVNLHAWGSSPKQAYHSWIDEQLRDVKIKSITPKLPNANLPKPQEWLDSASSSIGDENENCVLTARSLGCWTALNYAQSHKLRKLILVAPAVPIEEWYTRLDEVGLKDSEISCLKDFVNPDIDYKKIQENVGEILLVFSSNDPYIPFEQAQKFFQKRLPFARIMRVRGAGHFGAQDGYEKFPKLLDEILCPVRIDIKLVPNMDLPVLLPDDVDFKPTGQSPLTYSPSFEKGVEEKYGKGWKREMDTLDTFMCSSWYYFRYLDPKNDKEFACQKALDDWMPVDFYIGGPEHVNGHLLYSRFFTQVLFDAGYIDFDEPFIYHRHQGLILAEDGRKMSKRWNNVINPTDVVSQYGADTLRIYEMFMGPLEQTKAWSDSAVRGVRRFLERVFVYSQKYTSTSQSFAKPDDSSTHLNSMIKKVTEDTMSLKFNTSISEFMKYMNFVEALDLPVDRAEWESFLLILSPYAPFLTDFIWREVFNNQVSIHTQKWPGYDEKLLALLDINIAVQINGKTRGEVSIKPGSPEKEVTQIVIQNPKIAKYLQNSYKKVIYVEGKIINYIV